MNTTRKLMLIGFLLVTCIGCDQTTKHIARTSLQMSAPQSFLNDFLRLQYAENPGGMMSLGAELSEDARFWFLTVFVGCLLCGMLLFTLFARRLSALQIAALTLVVGGGFSNLLDRVHNDGYVIDFLNVGLGGLRTAIFNIADVLIIVGTALLLLASPLHARRSQHAGSEQTPDDPREEA